MSRRPATSEIRLRPMPEPTPQSDLLTAKEAAEYLRVSAGFIYDHSGKRGALPRLPVVRLGGKLLFKRSSLDRFIDQFEDKAEVA